MEGVRNLSRAARQAGLQPEIICLDPALASWLSSWDVPVHAVGQALGMFGYSRPLDRWLGEHIEQYDAVIVHSIWMYFSYAVWRKASRRHVPYYLFIHGALDPWFRTRYPLKHIKKMVYWLLIEHRVMRAATAVFFTTEEEMALARNAFQPYECNPVVIGYGISSPPVDVTFSTKEEIRLELTKSYPHLGTRPYLLFLGRLHEKKGIDLLLQAFSVLKDSSSNVALMIAGPGDQILMRRLKEMSSNLGLGERIVWTGPLYGEAKWMVMRGADVFVLPSHQENFGISVVEALGCGTPVLISNKVNIWREVCREGAGLIEPDTVEGTISLLRRWFALNAEERNGMEAKARYCFDAHFNSVNTSRRYLSGIRMHEQQATARRTAWSHS